MGVAPVYAEAEEVVELVRDPSKQPGVDYVVIDVRGEDYKVKKIIVSLQFLIVIKNKDDDIREDTFLVLLTFQQVKCMIKPTTLFLSMKMCQRFISIVPYHK